MGRSRGPRTSAVGHVADIGRGWADDGNGSLYARCMRGRLRDDHSARSSDAGRPIVLKNSWSAVFGPLAKISASQIGLQTARVHRLRVKRPLKTSRDRPSPSFSTLSAGRRPMRWAYRAAILAVALLHSRRSFRTTVSLARSLRAASAFDTAFARFAFGKFRR